MNLNIPLQRYSGSVIATGVYGRPNVRLTGKGMLVIALAIGLLAFAWANGFEGLFLGAGPVTLAQAKLNAADAIDRRVIDEFRKSSELLDRLPFVDASNPAGGGATVVYGYTRQITQRGAAFRAINSEYTPTEVTKQQYTVELKPLGGSFQIDRVLAKIGGPPAIAEVDFQLTQLIKATQAKFSDAVINGDTGVEADGFDGLSKALAGSSTEVFYPVLDFTAVDTQVKALSVMQRINAALGVMDGKADALLMNSFAKSWFTMIAALSGQLRSATDEFGRIIEFYNGIPLIDVGEKAGSSSLIIPNYNGTNEIQRVTITGTPTGGTFTLTFNGYTTAGIAYDANAAAVVAALEALPNIDSGEVTATGGALPGSAVDVTFKGKWAGINVPAMTASGAGLTGGTTPAVAITTPTPGGTGSGSGQTGLTDIYAVRFGADAFHGVKVPGQLINQWLPDFGTAGAVKTGEVEMGPVAVALKASKAAAVIRNVKVV